ncbi:hypothetical protein B0H12DRAFT_1133833 [Mycena haematopus]|nr:hypothetical protein B0H12DRAFT_1133833 [Mycena haematopus]
MWILEPSRWKGLRAASYRGLRTVREEGVGSRGGPERGGPCVVPLEEVGLDAVVGDVTEIRHTPSELRPLIFLLFPCSCLNSPPRASLALGIISPPCMSPPSWLSSSPWSVYGYCFDTVSYRLYLPPKSGCRILRRTGDGRIVGSRDGGTRRGPAAECGGSPEVVCCRMRFHIVDAYPSVLFSVVPYGI